MHSNSIRSNGLPCKLIFSIAAWTLWLSLYAFIFILEQKLTSILVLYLYKPCNRISLSSFCWFFAKEPRIELDGYIPNHYTLNLTLFEVLWESKINQRGQVWV